jgi:hypothetical protein
MHVAGAVKHLADLNPAIEQFGAGGLDVGNDQVQSLRGAGRRRGDVPAEDDRARRAGRRELDDPPVAGGEVGIQPPAEAAVKPLGAIDVRNRDDDDLELHVDRPRFGALGCSCHGSLLDVGEGVAHRRAPVFFLKSADPSVYHLDLVEVPRLSNFDCFGARGDLPGNTQWM